MSDNSEKEAVGIDPTSKDFAKETKGITCAYRLTLEDSEGEYIGSTVDLYRRVGVHKHKLRKGTHSSMKLQAEFDKSPNTERFKLDVSIQESKQAALDVEQSWITEAKAKGTLLNHSSNARNSGVGEEVSAETRAKLSSFRTGHKLTPEQLVNITAIRKATAPKGAEHHKSRKVVVDGVEYGSVGEAGRALGVHKDTMRLRVLNPNFPNVNYKNDELDNVSQK